MTSSNRSFTLVAALALAGTAGAAGAADLAQVYHLAKDRDPILREAEALYLAARETKNLAWAQYLPHVSAFFSQSSSDDSGSSTRFDAGPPPVFFNTLDDTSTDSSFGSLTLRQTVFSWSKIKHVRAAGASAAQAEAEYHYALQQFVIRVADRYFGQLSAADQLEAARLNREAIGRQLEQAKKRFEVGLIAVTDVQESQAAFDQATADEIAAERSFMSSREVLRESTGVFVDGLVRPGEGMPLIDPTPTTPGEWVKLALEQNLSLIASRFAAESAAHTLGAAWGAHYPTLDFVGEMSKSERDTSGTLDTGTPPITNLNTAGDGDSRSVALQLSVPIFAGGATQAGVRQAKYRSQAADQRLERVTRETQRTASDALLGVTSEIARTKALRQAAESSATALRATEAGFEVGTRTTVDVLDARRNLLRAQVNYRRAKYDYLLNTLRLKQAAGTLVEPDVAQVNNWLNAPSPVTEPAMKADTPKK